MDEPLYSVRMRASLKDVHISGAERIVRYSETRNVSSELFARAMCHERGRPDSITIKIESLAGVEIVTLAPLPVMDCVSGSVEEARELAVSELIKAGVSREAARRALDAITCGASSKGGNMRGAMIMDAVSGERLDTNKERGVRARSVDYHEAFIPALGDALTAHCLDHTHLREALALATKVAGAPGAVAELCISDDPSYVTGYVASPKFGYARITPMKVGGDRMGGRAFFVKPAGFDIEKYVAYLRETPVLVEGEFSIK